jgi:hypothetical protein
MRSVSTAPDQRFANQLAFDGGNGTAHQHASGLDFGGGKFGLTKDHTGRGGRFSTETIAQRYLPQRPNFQLQAANSACTPWQPALRECGQQTGRPRHTIHKHSVKNQKTFDSTIG